MFKSTRQQKVPFPIQTDTSIATVLWPFIASWVIAKYSGKYCQTLENILSNKSEAVSVQHLNNSERKRCLRPFPLHSPAPRARRELLPPAKSCSSSGGANPLVTTCCPKQTALSYGQGLLCEAHSKLKKGIFILGNFFNPNEIITLLLELFARCLPPIRSCAGGDAHLFTFFWI